jgi:hypothetical protein
MSEQASLYEVSKLVSLKNPKDQKHHLHSQWVKIAKFLPFSYWHSSTRGMIVACLIQNLS